MISMMPFHSVSPHKYVKILHKDIRVSISAKPTSAIDRVCLDIPSFAGLTLILWLVANGLI